MRATSVGPDLSRVFVRIEKPGYTGPDADQSPTAPDATAAIDDVPAADDSVPSGDATADPGPLPLSA